MSIKVALIIIENREDIKTEYAKFVSIVAWKRLVNGIFWWDGGRRPVWYMRQKMIEKVLKLEFDKILFIDSDVIPQEGFLDKLLSHNLPLVSGYYNDINGFPINRKFGTQFLGKGLMEVDVFSMGLSLISREVLEKVPYPEPDPNWIPDSDIIWCEDVRKAGFKVMCDFSVQGYHLLQGIF